LKRVHGRKGAGCPASLLTAPPPPARVEHRRIGCNGLVGAPTRV
jgi:hypothetical protein